MEEIAYMVCMRVDELDDPVEGSSTTACVECGDDIWISVESRKQMGKVGAMPVCSRCAARIAQEQPTEVREFGEHSPGQFQEVLQRLQEAKSLIDSFPEDQDLFDSLKETARAAGMVMSDPTSDWGSLCVIEDWEGNVFPPIPLGKILQSGVPKELVAKQLIPGLATAAQAKRAMFGFSTWTLRTEAGAMPDLEGSLADHPDHQESLILIEVTADGVQKFSQAEIIRDGVHAPQLGEWQDHEKPVATNGLFVDALIPILQLIKQQRETQDS